MSLKDQNYAPKLRDGGIRLNSFGILNDDSYKSVNTKGLFCHFIKFQVRFKNSGIEQGLEKSFLLNYCEWGCGISRKSDNIKWNQSYLNPNLRTEH